jgi:Arc/MetJ-type ribon-helix-helix transcriptional regulator
MKTITINVSDPVYREFQEHAQRTDRSTSELIREAMQLYRDERIRPRQSLRTLRPLSLGKVLRPLTREDDLLEEMLDG